MTFLPLVTAFNGLEALRTPAQTYLFQDHTTEESLQIAKDMVQSLYKYGGVVWLNGGKKVT
jgi:hypothetical protein